jgi:hypothetical protein
MGQYGFSSEDGSRRLKVSTHGYFLVWKPRDGAVSVGGVGGYVAEDIVRIAEGSVEELTGDAVVYDEQPDDIYMAESRIPATWEALEPYASALLNTEKEEAR